MATLASQLRSTTVTVSMLAAFATVLAAFAGLVSLPAPAHAETGYTYWGYHHLVDGTWVSSKKGAQNSTAQDGAVEGFRYATSITTPRPPRAVATFEEICAGTEASEGEKRIGIVLDYGTPQDAAGGDTPPQAEAACAVVPADATTQQALESVQPLRIENGLICAIGGYPSSGCAEEVENATVPDDEQQVDVALPSEAGQQSAESGMSWPLAGVGVLVLVLAGGAVMLARRRRA